MEMMPRGHQRQPALPQIQTIDLDQASRPAPRFSPGVHSHNVDNIELCPLGNHPGIVAPAAFKLFHDNHERVGAARVWQPVAGYREGRANLMSEITTPNAIAAYDMTNRPS
jgi:hypothetical protein